MLGAYVPVAMKNPATHAAGVAAAVKTAKLIAAVATTQAPYLVLADDAGTDPATNQAGRAHDGEGWIDEGRVEDLCERRGPDCARGVR